VVLIPVLAISFIVTAPFVELVRAMESITTMFLGHFFLTERPSLRCLFTLIPTCGGIALSCNNTEHFSIIGFIALCGSNFFFSARSVAARYLQQSSSTKLEPVNLFAEVSLYGLLVLVPITVIAESSVILKTAQGYGLGGETGTYNPDPQQYAQLQHLLVMVLTNGLAFAICNALSFVVLARTDLLTHCVLNVLRRVVAIFTGSVYFHVPLNAANISGVTISIGGVLLYTYFKYADRQA
jgi:drug/metabolite transporter (DMT)-like permease